MCMANLSSSALNRTPFCRHFDSRRVVPVSGGCHGADQWTWNNMQVAWRELRAWVAMASCSHCQAAPMSVLPTSAI